MADEQAREEILKTVTAAIETAARERIDERKEEIVRGVSERLNALVTAALAERFDKEKNKDATISLSDMLTHARSLFEYHAGQRLNSIRYYMIAYSFLIAGYYSSRGVGDEASSFLSGFALCVVTIIVTLCFWGLDIRNANLVKIDEAALKVLEERVAKAETPEFEAFKITENADQKPYLLSFVFRYSCLVHVVFAVMTALPILILLFMHDLARWQGIKMLICSGCYY